MNKTFSRKFGITLAGVLSLIVIPAHADTFGSGDNAFTIDFVNIGNAGNAADNTGYGAVGYNYRISKYEVSRGIIEDYNSLGGGPAITLFDMTSHGGNGVNRPATGVSWNEAARFVNWLNTSQGYSAAYKFTTGGANDDIELWTNSDAGYDPANLFRNSSAYYFLPSENEWYKAAYYDPSANGGTGGYWNYATGSDTAPTAVASGTVSGTAIYNQAESTGPADVASAGGLSPYGTMGQSGNAIERMESASTPPNDSVNEPRVLRDNYWAAVASSSSFRNGGGTTMAEPRGNGFRVASVPEPS